MKMEREREWDRPAMWACLMPFLESHSARTLVMGCGGNATEKGNSELYVDIVVMCWWFAPELRWMLVGWARRDLLDL